MADPTRLIRKITGDSLKLLAMAAATGLGFMTIHRPGSTEWTLVWAPERLGYALLGGLIAAMLVGAIRWRMWLREHPEALD